MDTISEQAMRRQLFWTVVFEGLAADFFGDGDPAVQDLGRKLCENHLGLCTRAHLEHWAMDIVRTDLSTFHRFEDLCGETIEEMLAS